MKTPNCKSKNYRVQMLDCGAWRTLACQDMPLASESDAVGTRNHFAGMNIENEYRAQAKLPAKFCPVTSACIGLGWKTI